MFTPVSLPTKTLSFIQLNVRSLKRYAIDIAYDKKLIEYDILFLTETQVDQTDDPSAMQSILEEHALDHNTSSFKYSSLAVVTKAPFLSHVISRKMIGFHFFRYLSKHILEKLLV